MKQFLLSATILSLGLSTVSAISLHGDFVTGFESGIFLRNNDNIYEEYGCPEAQAPGGLANLQ